MPDRHILLIVSDGTSQPIPAATAAWRAGICPAPAVRTWPMITYPTSDAGTFAFSSAAEIAIAPRSLPEKSFSEPINLPTGVRAPATITDVVINPPNRWCEYAHDTFALRRLAPIDSVNRD